MSKGPRQKARHSLEDRERALGLAGELGPTAAARQLNMSVHTLNNWLADQRVAAGIPVRPGKLYSQEFRDRAVQLALNSSAKHAAEELRVSKATMLKWFRSANPHQKKRRYSVYTQEKREAALALATKVGFIEAAFETGVAESTLRAWDTAPKQPRKAAKRFSGADKRRVGESAMKIGVERAAADAGVTPSTLRRWMKEAGQPGRAPFGEGTVSDIDFAWVSRNHPELEQWRVLAAMWAAGQTKALRAKLEALRCFFKSYLVAYKLPIEPAALLSRTLQLPDFFSVACPQSKAGISLSNYVHSFLQWVLAREFSVTDDFGRPVVSSAFHNPVPWHSFDGVMEREESAYSPLPHGYVDELRSMLAAGPHFSDWKWAQTALGAKAQGRGAIAPDWFEVSPEQIDKDDPDCVSRIRLRSTHVGGPVLEMWSPVRWVSLLIKLTLPLRTTQVRLLDSGELDASKYLYAPDCPGRTAWVANDSPLLAKHRANATPLGVFRYVEADAAYGASLYINTNKTADSAKSGAAMGYELPWLSTDPLHSNPFYWLAKLRDWQVKYNPISRAIPWTELDARHIVVKPQVQLARYPETCFLFRLPEAKEGDTHLPMGKDMMSRVWYLLLSKFESRLERRGETHANGAPIRLVSGVDRSVEFPLHSLRVSLITSLVLEGRLPLPIMQKLVGHSRLLMTLYYTKIGAKGIGKALEAALQQLRETAEGSIEDFLLTTEHSRLVKEAIANSATVFGEMIPVHPASRNAAGWMPMAHGLCLVGGNASPLEEVGVGGCYNGGENIGTETNPKFAPVPGGARNCVRCRWFVTAPRYIDALVGHFNVISYHCDEARDSCLTETKRVEELKALRLSDEEQGRLFSRSSELKVVERGYEQVMQVFNERVLDLGACYRLIARCLLAASKQSEDDGGKLIAVGSLADLRVATEQVDSELLQLAEVCETAEAYPDFDAGKAVFRRSQLLDAALHREGLPPIFMALSEGQQLQCGNEYLRSLARKHSPENLAAGRRAVIGIIDGGKALSEHLGLDLRPMLRSIVEPTGATPKLKLGVQ